VTELQTQPGTQPVGPDREPLLRVERMSRHFKIGSALSRHTLHAVDDVSFTVGEREIVAIAGESGSGKSTVARVLAKSYKPTGGEAYFQGKPLSAIRSRRERLRYSGLVPMVFQDPFASLNPVFRVSHGVMRALKLHRPELTSEQRLTEAVRVFDAVGLNPGAEVLERYPRAQRRAAAASRVRPGAGDAAPADPRRRTGLHAGRVHSHRAAQRDGQAA
jgi:ABC-type oligopeptide transport system ATPase subunit